MPGMHSFANFQGFVDANIKPLYVQILRREQAPDVSMERL